MMNDIIKRLLQGIYWITIKFPDNSVRVLRTTLNNNIMADFGVKSKVGYFYDLDRGEYVRFREDATDVSLSEEKPLFEEEVITFANRFI